MSIILATQFGREERLVKDRDSNMIRAIVGLGNPGVKYANNRHNLGFMVIDRIASKWALDFTNSDGSFAYSVVKGNPNIPIKLKSEVYLFKPLCYMNNSGIAVRKILDYFNFTPEEILVAYDDIDLPLGKIRLRREGSSGGHKGIESIIQSLQTENFPRLRLGIGPQGNSPAEEFVLANFKNNELDILDRVIDIAIDCIVDSINYDLSNVMNKYNRVDLTLVEKSV